MAGWPARAALSLGWLHALYEVGDTAAQLDTLKTCEVVSVVRTSPVSDMVKTSAEVCYVIVLLCGGLFLFLFF